MSYHYDPINILDTSNSTGLGSGGSMTIGGGISIGRDTFIGGNLAISGTVTSFSDNILLINSNPQSSSDTGILFERHISDIQNEHNYTSIIYKESDDEFVFGYIENDVDKEVNSFSGYTAIKANSLVLTSTENSSFTNSGSLSVLGGINISKDTFIGGKLTLSDALIFNTTGNGKSSIEFESTQYLYIGNNKTHIQINGNDTENNPGHIELAYNTYTSFIHKTNNGNALNEVVRITTSGNIGIGTTTPSYKLDVIGDINYTGNLLNNGELVSQSESQWKTSVNDIYYTNGNVGIGTTSPQSLLHVNGQIFCNTIITTSDERLKKDIGIADTEKCYTTLKNLPLKSFRWNNDVLNLPDLNNEFRIGWIAQDVEEIIPNSVETIPAYGLTDCKTINIDQIVALMFGTIQQLQKKIEEMEKLQFIDR
jgi:hypothetical protein